MATQCIELRVSTTKSKAACVKSILDSVKNSLVKWRQNYRSRADLGELSDHMLKDIGITRSQAQDEATKPFWRS
ncbi:DUF1127 domain-containing protein [Motiliproteus sp. MSK22-1]|uniref:DUF1127 domain-containing protein n=1 Tax=Motiliproteus sp. MSK22-1 TaxID=1897630 RepID=UPI000975F416|nr:DUF1127 domain-containing protein [Motiliproteus sp. MSK22-1]OMH32817.1 hypothetical protein BGP75_14955 [Motiliproteus sp. MSK22-1]